MCHSYCSRLSTTVIYEYYSINVVNTIQQIWFNAKNRMQYTKTFTAGTSMNDVFSADVLF